jgi:hypothetical protein
MFMVRLIRSRLIIIFVTKRVQYMFGLKLIRFRGGPKGDIFLLRPRRERPSHRAAEKHDELATPE